MRNEPFDDSRANTASTVSSSFPTSDTRSAVQEGTTVPIGGTAMNGSRIMTGASDLLGLLRILGEGYRMSCMYRCKVVIIAILKERQFKFLYACNCLKLHLVFNIIGCVGCLSETTTQAL